MRHHHGRLRKNIWIATLLVVARNDGKLTGRHCEESSTKQSMLDHYRFELKAARRVQSSSGQFLHGDAQNFRQLGALRLGDGALAGFHLRDVGLVQAHGFGHGGLVQAGGLAQVG